MEDRPRRIDHVGFYRLADLNVELHSVYPDLQEYCAAYRTQGTADIVVNCTQDDIEYQRERFIRFGLLRDEYDTSISDARIETVQANMKIADQMFNHDCFLLHGAAVAVDNACFVFTAFSGTGKSTHIRLWQEMLGDRMIVVNGDKPYVRIQEDGSAIVYGSPWDGKERLSTNISVPLHAICFLERSVNNRIERISGSEALPILYNNVYKPADPVLRAKMILLIGRMKTKYYRLGCNMDITAAELSYNTMKE